MGIGCGLRKIGIGKFLKKLVSASNSGHLFSRFCHV